jgi:hypothetical protein
MQKRRCNNELGIDGMYDIYHNLHIKKMKVLGLIPCRISYSILTNNNVKYLKPTQFHLDDP